MKKVQPKGKTGRTAIKKIAVTLVLIAMIVSTMGIVVSHQHTELIALGAGQTLVPTGVNNTLNITFSGVTYTTVPPAMEYDRNTGYNVAGATWYNTSGVNMIGNYTYLVLNNTGSASNFAQVQYNLSSFSSRSYYFQESKIAYNGTSDISMIVSPSKVTNAQVTSSTTTVPNSILITIVNGALNVYTSKVTNSTSGASTFSAVSSTTLPSSINALQFYDISVYVYPGTSGDDITVGLINPTNGNVMGTAVVSNDANISYNKLNYSAYQFTGSSANGGESALILDWGYNVFSGSSALATSDGISPFVASSAYNIIAPFDPSATSNTSYQQAPNATAIHTNTKVGASDFNVTGSSLSNSNQSLLASDVNTTYAVYGNGNNTTASGMNAISSIASAPENTTAITADIHVSIFSASGINTAIMNFLKSYTAMKASGNGITYYANNMTIISYTIENIQVDQILTSAQASAVRNAFDNEIPALLKENNLALVDNKTSTIVAGAFAGFFYYDGGALAPTILANGEIQNPITGQTFKNLSDAGFASGAYISGGAIIVPQLTIVGWDAGTPIFAYEAGFSFGSIFGGLTSAGKSVSNFFSSGLSDIGNAVVTSSKTLTNDATAGANDIIEPVKTAVASTTKTVDNNINNFKNETSALSNSVMSSAGIVTGDVQKSISGALGPVSGAVKDLSSSLSSAQNALVTAVASGATGLKTDIYGIGTQIDNSTRGIINTLGAKISDANAVMSSMFTAIKSIPSAVESGLSSVLSVAHNDTMNALDVIGTTISSSLHKVYTDSFGTIANDIMGLGGQISKDAKGAFSAIDSFGAKLGFILEIVGITIAVVAIVIVAFIFYFKIYGGGASKVAQAGETKI